MQEIEKFRQESLLRIQSYPNNQKLQDTASSFFQQTISVNYSYNFTWLGLPIIQYPQDIVALQEIIWQVKPDLIIEAGIARGGSLVFIASMLELIGGNGQVLGIDIDIREHNRIAIENHPMAKRITMIQGSSIAPQTIQQVYDFANGKEKVLLLLDSNHTHDHVLAELKAYTPLVSIGSYCIVYDTVIEDMPADYEWKDRPWGKGNNPKTAVWEFLKENDNFEIDKTFQDKLLITVAPDGYLKRVK
ncbi:cephalosporin hydroxylase family protein [Thermoflexibacter ruber]|uniref:Cephalosporin hydroxylase n=1 Tax=Thermoflexibacter ruber TaxID=1003 RepID=A0A1I2GMI5_9BACT|nr:cephalosporin hydroxylase family protein [Thermoflexibacter ruber]SFF18219.1 Cephalosporin hydroxylase [Thermoflexibacter ruber]